MTMTQKTAVMESNVDDADNADNKIQCIVDEGIERSRRALRNMLTACGVCYSCESPLNAGRLFCNLECSGDWERDRQRKKELGL